MKDDLISRQAAIDVINRAVTKEAARWSIEELPSAQPEPTEEQVVEYCKRRCLRIVTDDFFQIAQPQWIPCSERLPEKDGRYLVTCTKGGALAVDWNIWHNDTKPSWLWEQSVTAWMPLPEPYKAESEET